MFARLAGKGPKESFSKIFFCSSYLLADCILVGYAYKGKSQLLDESQDFLRVIVGDELPDDLRVFHRFIF